MRRFSGTAVLLVVLAGCAPTPAPAEQAPPTSASFPITVEHSLGTTTVPQQPTRVFTLGTSDIDTVLALGVVPVGIHSRYGFTRGVGPWAEDELGSATPTVSAGRELNYEAIAATQPDLILNVISGGDREEYDTLSRIAPTIPLPAGAEPYSPTWREAALLVAQSLGKQAEGEALVADTEEYLRRIRTDNPSFDGRTLTYMDVMGGENYVGGSATTVVALMREMGFRNSPFVDALPATDTQHSLSGELLPQADADVVLVYGFGAGRDELLAGNVALANLGAVREDRTYFLPDLALSSPSVLSIPYGVDRMLPFLQTATG